MAHKGLGIRTPRTRALELGTAPAGFEGAVDVGTYDAQAGYPRAAQKGGVYECNVQRTMTDSPSRSIKSPIK
jgi:hypothetical protein